MYLTDINLNELPDYWRKIYKAANEKESDERNIYLKNIFLNEYLLKGYVSKYTFKDFLKMDESIFVNLFTELYYLKLKNNKYPRWILEKENNPDWMKKRDYIFFNIRGVSLETENTGDIISAASLLLLIRATGIHLAPFFECSEGIIYCQKSFYDINSEIVNKKYLDAGVSKEEQMKFFIDCAHLLNKVVGFDVAPHTGYNSILRLERPELFRWIKVNMKTYELSDGKKSDGQYEDEYQKQCQKEIEEIVLKCKGNNKSYDEINCIVANKGYFTVPPHTWNGVSVPEFKRFSNGIKRPVWEYKDRFSMDAGEHAISLHANFYVHKNMKANKVLKGSYPRNEDFFEFYIEYIKENIEKYKFDYIRFDYVDHIFDNVKYDDKTEIPLNEMLTPNDMKYIVSEVRKKYKGLGVQADHIGEDVNNYEKAGVNLIISDVVKSNYLTDVKEVAKYAEKTNNSDCSAMWGIDTQDMAHPLFCGKEVALREGCAGMLIRFFMSRFINVGLNRRPVYSVIGNQDMSYGIHRVNNRPESLSWKDNKDFQNIYHKIEDIYENEKDDLNEAKIVTFIESTSRAIYLIESKNKKYICVIPLLSNISNQAETVNIAADFFYEWPVIENLLCVRFISKEFIKEKILEKVCDIDITDVGITMDFKKDVLMLIKL